MGNLYAATPGQNPGVARCLFYSCLRLSPRVSHCLPLSPGVSHCLPTCACIGWSTFPKSCFSLSPIVSLDMCACVGWCLRLGSYPPSRGLVSHCLPTRVPVLDVVPAFPRSCPHMWPVLVVRPLSRGLVSPLSPLVSLLVSLCWMVCPPSRGFLSFVSQLISQLVSFLSPSLSPNLSPNLSFFLFPFVAGGSDFAFLQTMYCWGRLS